MPRHPKSKPPKRDTTLTAAAEREAVLRELASRLQFRMLCGNRACKRAASCAGDAERCFARHWRLVPEEVKVSLRAGINARVAGLPRGEIDAQVARELALWRETHTRAEAPAPQAPMKLRPMPPRVRTL
jgi:hypothetical protein